MGFGIGGILKIVAIVLGIVVLGLESYAYDETHEYLDIISLIPGINWSKGLEATLIAFSVICILGTSAFLVLSLMSKGSGMIKKIDMCFHLFGAIVLLIGAICLFYAAIHVDSKCTGNLCGKTLKYSHKLAAASLATLNAILYVVIAVFAGKGK